jgi:hypothetical protein
MSDRRKSVLELIRDWFAANAPDLDGARWDVEADDGAGGFLVRMRTRLGDRRYESSHIISRYELVQMIEFEADLPDDDGLAIVMLIRHLSLVIPTPRRPKISERGMLMLRCWLGDILHDYVRMRVRKHAEANFPHPTPTKARTA